VILDILTRWFLHIERRAPPPGVDTADGLCDIANIFDADAGRQEAKAKAAARRRRPPDDAWLRQ
jgi:hypothetical protein